MTTKRASTIGLRKGVAAEAPAERAVPESAPSPRPRPEKPVRFTLDLDRGRHDYLKRYALSIDAKASEVIRELLDELGVDQDLQTRVGDRIWQRRLARQR